MEQERLFIYSAPRVELVEMEVEKGFAISLEDAFYDGEEEWS